MTAALDDYMEALQLTDVLRERVIAIQTQYESLVPGAIVDMFITDYVNSDNVREFENLWFFGPQFIMEAKLFQTTDDFDLSIYRARMERWQITKENFVIGQTPSAESRMVLHALVGPISMNMKASAENCQYLISILERHLIPNLRV